MAGKPTPERPSKKKVAKKKTTSKRRAPPPPPSKFSVEVCNEICDRMITGESLRSICFDKDLPGFSTVMRWLAEGEQPGADEEKRVFLSQYNRAQQVRAEVLVEDILDIADNVAEPVMVDGMPLVVNGEVVKVVTPAGVQHARLRVDTRKWAASKMKPKKYGDKVQAELSGPDGGPIQTENTWVVQPVKVRDA